LLDNNNLIIAPQTQFVILSLRKKQNEMIPHRTRNPHNMTNTTHKGFTLIELLVVVSIIGLLSSIVLASLEQAKKKARDMTRLSDLKQLQIALEMYRLDVGSYPATFAVGDSTTFKAEISQCISGVTGSGYLSDGYIPGLVTKYISTLPKDPAKSTTPPKRCYAYASNGTDYMVMAINSEGYNPPTNLQRTSDHLNISIAIFTPGAIDW